MNGIQVGDVGVRSKLCSKIKLFVVCDRALSCSLYIQFMYHKRI